MNNENKSMTDKIIEAADRVYGTAVDRKLDRMNQVESNMEKDIEVAKKASDAIVDAADVVISSQVDRIMDLIKGEKIDLSKGKTRTIEVIDRVVDKADVYYGLITDRIMEKLAQREQNIAEDIEIGRQLVKDLNSNS